MWYIIYNVGIFRILLLILKGAYTNMEKNYSPEIAKAVENFLSENGWGYEPII